MIKIFETESGGFLGISYSPHHTLSVMPFEFQPAITKIDDPSLKPRLEKMAKRRGGEVTYHPNSQWEAAYSVPNGFGLPKRKLFASVTEASDNEWVDPETSRFL